jgi:UDP-arabinose 4-epimerase
MKAGVEKMVLSSTAAVYGEPKKIPITESSAQWPVNPYGWSKVMMERLLASYDTAYGMKSISLRYSTPRAPQGDAESCTSPNRIWCRMC